MDASHEFLEHTSELELRVRAPSLARLLEEAGSALGALLLRGSAADVGGPPRAIGVQSCDRAALLVDWLNELIFHAEAERWVPVQIAVELASDTALRAQVRGVMVEEAPALVKAATYHGLEVREVAGGLEAEVIFDI